MDDQQPNVNGLPGMGGPVPNISTPPPQVQMAPQQQAPDPTQVAQAAQIAHDSAFGKMAKSLMGLDNQYSVGPDGTLQNNPVQEKPGSFFRKLLGASLLGGAAGAAGNPAQGFAGGLVRGGAAGAQQAQQQDQQKQQQAQQDFKDNQQVQSQNREQTMMNAQLQQMHSEQVARQHTSDLQDQAAHDKHNAASAALVTNLTKAGGTPASIPVNGKTASEFTANDLAQAYIKDPSILKAPTGYMRTFVDTTDSSGLTYNGTNWIDDAGKPVNMTDNTTVKAIDTPIDAMKTKIPTTGQEINAAYGGKLVDPDKTYPMAPTDMIALNSKRMANDKIQSDTDYKKKQAAQKDQELGLKARELRDKEQGPSGNQDGLLTAADPKNVGPDGVNHTFLDTMRQSDSKRADLIQSIGEGREIPSSYMLARKDGQALLSDVHAAYPDFDDTKLPAYQKMLTSYTSGKDKDQLEAINTAFRHMSQAYTNAANPLAIVPGTPAHATYNSDTEQLKEEINSAYTHGVLTKEKSESLKGDLQSSFPITRRAAIKEVFGLMSDKAEEKQRSWQRAKPSKAIADFSFVSPEAQTAFTAVTGKHISPTGELGSPENGQNTDQAARQPFVPPTGAFAGRDGQGNIVQYKLPNGTIVDAKTGQPVKP